jgi:hypothetical protein
MSDDYQKGLSEKDALDQAWSWFEVHAAQRMQSLNFFLIATAFLVAAYGTVLDRHSGIAALVAAFGAWITFWFYRMERRTRQLVKAGEAALQPMQAQLAEIAANPSMSILTKVETSARGASTYGTVIPMIQLPTVLVFLALAIYASWRYLQQVPLLL